MNHVFIAASCIHCGCDDHDEAADYPCPVEDSDERQASWTFGPDYRDEIPG